MTKREYSTSKSVNKRYWKTDTNSKFRTLNVAILSTFYNIVGVQKRNQNCKLIKPLVKTVGIVNIKYYSLLPNRFRYESKPTVCAVFARCLKMSVGLKTSHSMSSKENVIELIKCEYSVNSQGPTPHVPFLSYSIDL